MLFFEEVLAICIVRVFLRHYKITIVNVINQTSLEFDLVINKCRNIFLHKFRDYGASWRVMRVPSIVDQVFIKAQRIRTIEEKKNRMVDEDSRTEFMGIINYCVIGLIQLSGVVNGEEDPEESTLSNMFDLHISETKSLMEQKNHDYGEAWREMQVSTFTDMLLMRVLRIRQLLQSAEKSSLSEGIESNFRDMINYCVFALIRSEETGK